MLESIFKTILDMTLSSSFLIAAVLIARVIMRKSSKVFRKILWGLVALKLIIPFSFESTLSLVPHKSQYVSESQMVSVEVQQAVQNAEWDLKSMLPFIWVSIFMAFAIYGLVSFIRLKYKVSDAVKYENNIFQSEKVESPFVFGVIKPKIYIPYNIKGEKLDFVLAHEKTHIRYFDHLTKLMGFVLLCIHWFNPLVWVSYALFCKDLELACDEAVIRNMSEGKRKGYALTLCDIGVNKAKISACPIAFGEVSIKERVKSTLSYKKIGKFAIALSLCLCVVVAVCFMTKPVAEAKEKVDETIVEETTVPATQPVTEPVTEPITEPIVEETVTENNIDSGNYVAYEYNKKQTPTTEDMGDGVGAAKNSLEKGNYNFNEGGSGSPIAYDGDVVIETTKAPETEGSNDNSMFKPSPLPPSNYNNNSHNNASSGTNNNSYNNPYNNPSNDSFVIIWDSNVTNPRPQSPYKPGFQNNHWVGWNY